MRADDRGTTMSTANTKTANVQRPKSLRPKSLLKRAVFGLIALVFGIVGAAWLMHASISAAPVARAATTTNGKTEPVKVGTGRLTVVRPY